MADQPRQHRHQDSTGCFSQMIGEEVPVQGSPLQVPAMTLLFQTLPTELPATPPTTPMVCVGEQEPQTRKTLGEGDEESEVEGLTSTLEVLNPSLEGFSTINFPNMPLQPHSADPPTLPPWPGDLP